MFQGKMKALTFSYDDGVTQDIRFIELMNKYGLKATFNLNFELLGMERSLVRDGVEISHNKVSPTDVRSIYEGHEIAAHTLTHSTLTTLTDDREILRQVEEDRLRLSELCGYEVLGFAYPGGGVNFNERIARLIESGTGVRYARTTLSSHGFAPQEDLFTFNPTVYHHKEFDRLQELWEQFLQADPTTPQVFYVWGHTYEFDIRDDWRRFEEFCQTVAGHPDVFYGTNRQILLSQLNG